MAASSTRGRCHWGSSDHRDAGDGQANRTRHLRWEGAVINHYAIRSRDLFLLKNHRGDGMRSAYNKRYFLHSRWHRAANANDTEDRPSTATCPR
jgi:hypothetical protein